MSLFSLALPKDKPVMKYEQEPLRPIIAKEASTQLSFGFAPPDVMVNAVTSPAGYKGLAGFHKYWGKKPIECLGFLLDKLTQPRDIVVDPFVGSGLIARECALRHRRFIGIDINPVSIELTQLICDLPSREQYEASLRDMEMSVRGIIDDSYNLPGGEIASHYLWEHNSIKEIWLARKGNCKHQVSIPTSHDNALVANYESYESRHIRPLQFFKNSRINTMPSLTLSDIFTGRALRNIDLIIENMPLAPENLRRALLLTLTASIGQMSNMVFAITGRGKMTGKETGKIEVGSWVIGYWRPPLHFEINVWNCFRRRADKLLTALSDLGQSSAFLVSTSADDVYNGSTEIALLNEDSINALRRLPDSNVTLVLTDPPHSDRIPYLELSELWNAILGKDAKFADEIVVSNAKERGKTKAQYNQKMCMLLKEVARILVPGGTLALLFNAKDAESWNGLMQNDNANPLQYYGCFPMAYSANSVVQDNRTGSMKSDYVLLYRKLGIGGRNGSFEKQVCMIPGWSQDFPKTRKATDDIHVSVS